MRRRTGACLFCGATDVKLTREHVLPRWTREALGLMGPVTMLKGTENKVIRRDETLAVVLRHVVCEPCNTGWLAKLEDDAGPILAPMMVGDPVALNEELQRISAYWAIKTALLLELALAEARGPSWSPESNLRWLFDHRDDRALPEGSQVWLAGVDSGGTLVSWSTGTRLGPADHPLGYIGAFSLGYLVFEVFGQDINEAGTAASGPTFVLVPPDKIKPYLVPVWPLRHPLMAWPPAWRLTQDELGPFANWYKAGLVPFIGSPPTGLV